MDNKKPKFIPTPEEIKAATLEIQKDWSEDERRRRYIENQRVAGLGDDVYIDNLIHRDHNRLNRANVCTD